jgi:hypothetical protein
MSPMQIVRPARLEERAVAAIVLDHEQPHQQRRRGRDEHEHRPEAVIGANQHGGEQRQERQAGVQELDPAAARIGRGIGCYEVAPRTPRAAGRRQAGRGSHTVIHHVGEFFGRV